MASLLSVTRKSSTTPTSPTSARFGQAKNLRINVTKKKKSIKVAAGKIANIIVELLCLTNE